MPEDRLDAILKSVQADLYSVETTLGKIIAQMEKPVKSMLRTSLRGGKRLRPAVVILCGRLFEIPRTKMHRLAAAVEVLHSATLIHDDLVDNAALRRGRKTIHTVWPVGAAVLAGDYLLAQSVSLVAQLDNPGVLKILADTLYTMSAGEIDYHYSQRDRKRREVYFESINAKTASLFAGAMEMIGVLAHAEASKATDLRNFGHEFGVAYQIVDDVLDIISDKKSLGKPVGSDLAQGIVTLPVICYLGRRENERVLNKILSGKGNTKDIQATIKLIRESGAIDDALDEAKAHARKSRAALAKLPAKKARRVLLELVDYVTERRH